MGGSNEKQVLKEEPTPKPLNIDNKMPKEALYELLQETHTEWIRMLNKYNEVASVPENIPDEISIDLEETSTEELIRLIQNTHKKLVSRTKYYNAVRNGVKAKENVEEQREADLQDAVRNEISKQEFVRTALDSMKS